MEVGGLNLAAGGSLLPHLGALAAVPLGLAGIIGAAVVQSGAQGEGRRDPAACVKGAPRPGQPLSCQQGAGNSTQRISVVRVRLLLHELGAEAPRLWSLCSLS